jgi:Na+/proline symporter
MVVNLSKIIVPKLQLSSHGNQTGIMNSTQLLFYVIGYFAILLVVAWYTSRNSNNDSFFIGNRKSNWMLVAFGMIGTSLSGVTFVSVPGTVGVGGFAYFQVVIGYVIGYAIITWVLLPLFYRLNLTSIYNYLQHRFGMISYKTGALFFIVSRILGATARLYLVINVLQIFILKDMNVSFALTTFIILLMILLYTFEGGVKTIVFTDTLQTTCMLLGLVVCIVYIMNHMGHSFGSTLSELNARGLTKIFNTDVNSSGFFLKQIIGGMFITATMTGLDQEMMQKNISVRTLRDSQKNVISFTVILVVVNFLFLFMGGLLYLFASTEGVVVPPDDLFPTVALHHMGTVIPLIFVIGLISALFPSADGALTALTSSFCIDILGLKRKTRVLPTDDMKAMEMQLKEEEKRKRRIRLLVHFSFAMIFFLMVMGFKWMNNKSIIDVILKVAGFTYGPLLGLFAFGMLTKRQITDRLSILVCLAAPLIIWGIDFINNIQWYQAQFHLTAGWVDSIKAVSTSVFGKFKIGYELLIYNGLLTFLGLLLISRKQDSEPQA